MKTETSSKATVTKYTGYVFASAPTAFEAFSAMTDAIGEAGGDWEVKGPFGVGILNGAIVTGQAYEAKIVRRSVCSSCRGIAGCSDCAYGEPA